MQLLHGCITLCGYYHEAVTLRPFDTTDWSDQPVGSIALYLSATAALPPSGATLLYYTARIPRRGEIVTWRLFTQSF